MKKGILLYIFALFISSCHNNSEKILDFSDQVDALCKELDTKDKPGVAIAVIKDGKRIYSKGFGMANLEHNTPITPNSVFDIASVSKQFVGFSIALLVEQGKLSLDDDVKTYIPEFPNFVYPITIKHLLHHQSGLRDWVSALKLSGVQLEDVVSFEKILEMTYKQTDLNFIPGEQYSYSNTGYNILVEVIQRITEQPFTDWTKTHIFEPLGMANTHFKTNNSEVIYNSVNSYYEEENTPFFYSPNNLTAMGSSSLQTSLNDLAKWMQNLDNPKVGKPSTIKLLQKQGVLNSGEITNYAFGVELDEYKGLKRIAHDGSWASFNTYVAYLPEHHFSVVVLFNRPWWAQDMAQKIIDIYLADVLEAETEEPDVHITPYKDVIDLKVLESYLGTYHLEADVYVHIFLEDDKMYAQATGEDQQVMTAVSETKFWVESYEAYIEFGTNRYIYKGKTYEKKKLMKPLILEYIDNYTGKFYSEELNTVYDVKLDNGKLELFHLRNGSIPLHPKWHDGFETDAWFTPIIEFQRNGENEVISFTATQFRSRYQKFVKIK
ncbi:serine hydrolase domain-containing protein [uncultured Aquimarina sp.]|uniref:serine hydrolase domain-containing protein n=1 Tax=uncultured Aquimarina sp. TaxID=575652 RepID=UPI0026047872|nr:serine hydrolase domain-containing protein [uncultured Aquimarina sp.]